MFSKTYRWLLLGKADTVLNELAELNVLVDSEFIVAEELDIGDFLLQAVYKIKPEAEWIVEYYGSWTNKSGLNKSQERIMSNAVRRKDLKGNTIVTSLVITDNRTRYNLADLTNTFIDPVTKSTFHAINNLYEFLNATRLFIFSDSWGHPVNGSWTGMNGDIYTGKADLCGTISFMNKDRMEILEYITIPGFTSMSKIVFRQPPLSYQYNLFTLPFTTAVWYCLGGFILILVIILYVNAKWDIKKCEDYEEADYARDPIRKAFYETKISPKGYKPIFISLEEGVKRLQTKPFAFNMNIGTGYRIVSQYFREHEKCGLREIDYIQGRKPWFCCKKESPYTEMYRVGLLRIEEHGLNTRNNRMIFVKKPLCTVTSGNFESVKMVDFYPALLMLLYGVLLAFALLLAEILLHRSLEMKENFQRNIKSRSNQFRRAQFN
ncbi:unnamed protein product [Arctia plantaginis]|uniref:Ionotropic receptor 75a N-terminal domain-containing protein n=1 Tax=Arctia plantaginis TaxID=874455 RepID=A0A8S0YY92_ARCPL|nr:unnamed protein product [Arctia plantaginis]